LDKEVYIFDLDAANSIGLDQRPSYFKLYDVKEDLEMTSLFAKDYDQLVKRMATDDAFYDKYFRSDQEQNLLNIKLGIKHYYF
jgi:hypothetical protein